MKRLHPLARIAGSIALVLGSLSLPVAAPAEPIRLLDLAGDPVDPFDGGQAGALVFLFVRTDCPISNRYAPEFRRIFDEFSARGVRFWLVYPDPDEPIAAIRRHIADYDYPGDPLRDPKHDLVRRTEATVTPEAAVFSPEGQLTYRGRIDDRYVAFGKTRPAPTTRDLRQALEETLAGKPVSRPRTRAVGCYIPGL